MKKIVSCAVLLYALISAGCLYSPQAGENATPTLSLPSPNGLFTPGACFENGECVSLEIAYSPQERAKGLMNRSFLPPSAGMLFVFEQSAPHSFWMKNTLIPLDIMWMDESFRVVGVQTMHPCREQAPCPLHSPAGSARYALEVNAGIAERNGVREGSELIVEGLAAK